ncbi:MULTISPECIES: type I restriction endonuclease subunit R [unclassified Micromonospora]|uniref:type I restriction endonuclease subunit R n=1 Tax=unclassified Micromonospora TaxID=2617518 RepID=UPI00098CF5EC|nr:MULTISPECIES: type I restriction endonuclease subunit R [unclassified Micromonospora]MDI5936679.1 type I restriction endonuclease subunit R [Micromonospora sp. DH15]OON33281.1 DEAD/DEAH box helicase [Micromonospora sp. Rc5]
MGFDGRMNEAGWEALALEQLGELGWEPGAGKDFAPGSGQRRNWADLVLVEDLRAAIERLNPDLPPTAVADAVRVAADEQSGAAFAENREAHKRLVHGISIVYTDAHGAEHNPTVRLVDLHDPGRNVYRAINQVTVIDGDFRRRLDIVLYLNGLPVAIVELKNAADENATLTGAHAQLETYLAEFPLAFRHAVLCLISEGITAKYGTPFTPYEHFAPWNVDDEGVPVDTTAPDYDGPEALIVALHGLFNQRRFLELTSGFVNFTPKGKRIAKAHQYFAVVRAVECIVRASRSDGKAGVVWHTQGSGKSEEMVCTAALTSRQPALKNPTIVVLTDRTDLDDQLYETFQDSQLLLGQEPEQAETRAELRDKLSNRNAGGIIFTTLQKFGRTREEREAGRAHPLLSDRRNILVIVDEAHRSHYDSLDGYARHLRDALPYATFIAFTGTPIASAEVNTRAVFGDYIDVYDLKRAVDDEATVRVYHEPRIIPVSLPPDIDPDSIDEQVETLTASLDDAERRRAEAYAATMNTIYGAPDRVETLAKDLVAHWEKRRELMKPQLGGPGKAMLVCATREICVRVFDAIKELKQREGWADPAVDKGKMKIVFHSAPSDEEMFRPHHLRPSQQKIVQARAKNPDDPLELLIVHSMLLTGYDAPPIHTIYMDRPMKGANLMQALARVNRRFREKQDGLLVGYAPLTENLRKALTEYTPSDQEDQTLGRDIDRAVSEVHNEIAAIEAMVAPVKWRAILDDAKIPARWLRAVRKTVNFLRDPRTPGNAVEPGTKPLHQRFRDSAGRMERFYALCSSSNYFVDRAGDIQRLRRDIQFFRDVRVWIVKEEAADREARGLPNTAQVERYLAALAAEVVDAADITDIYEEAGLGKLDITELNEVALQRLRDSETPHLAVSALRRLIEQKMREVTKHNVVRQERFSAQLEDLMNRYMRQQLTSTQLIVELVELAKQVSADARRGHQFDPPLNHAELAFYDAVAQNGAATELMGIGTLAEIARELVRSIQSSITVDWFSREPVRAKLRSHIRRLLARYDYPPDHERAAVDLVIRQMETFANEWAPGGNTQR